jgi:CRP-like cAMP-binding protein
MSTPAELNDPLYPQPRSISGVANLISRAEIVAAMGDDAPTPLQILLSRAHRARYQQQDVLYHHGNDSSTVFFITAGLVKLVAYLPSGRARIVRLHRPGSILGLGGLLGFCHEHTGVAVTAVSVLRLPLCALQRLRSEDPASYIGLAERWHGYLQDADMWITQFSTGPIRGRVARLLALLASFEPATATGQLQLLSCDEMASILGVTIESVSRTLAQFKRQHILTCDDRKPTEFYDTDIPRLRSIAEEL